PIHVAFHSLAVRSPMPQDAGSLQSETFPFLSHVLTRHQQCCREGNALPAYRTLNDWSEVTLPLDHRSPWLFASFSFVLATWISHAVCICPRSPSRATFTHESRGLATSTTCGFTRYSHRSWVGESWARAERAEKMIHERVRMINF